MRKLFLLFSFLFFINLSYSQKVQFGLNANPNIGWFKIDNKDFISNNSARIGFSYGLTLDYNFLENVALNIEPVQSFVNCSSIANDTNHKSPHKDVIVNWKIQYIEIPFCLKMKTNDIGKFKYYGKIGFAPMIVTASTLNSETATSNINSLNFSLIIGAGFHYSLGGNTALLAGLSFHNCLGRLNQDNTFKDQKIDGLNEVSLANINLKPVYISIDLGIMF